MPEKSSAYDVELTITGGKFSTKPEESYLAENYYAQNTGDGYYTITPSQASAIVAANNNVTLKVYSAPGYWNSSSNTAAQDETTGKWTFDATKVVTAPVVITITPAEGYELDDTAPIESIATNTGDESGTATSKDNKSAFENDNTVSTYYIGSKSAESATFYLYAAPNTEYTVTAAVKGVTNKINVPAAMYKGVSESTVKQAFSVTSASGSNDIAKNDTLSTTDTVVLTDATTTATGATVYLTYTPSAAGKVLEAVTLTDAEGKVIYAQPKKDELGNQTGGVTEYTFTMPAADVTLNAVTEKSAVAVGYTKKDEADAYIAGVYWMQGDTAYLLKAGSDYDLIPEGSELYVLVKQDDGVNVDVTYTTGADNTKKTTAITEDKTVTATSAIGKAILTAATKQAFTGHKVYSFTTPAASLGAVTVEAEVSGGTITLTKDNTSGENHKLAVTSYQVAGTASATVMADKASSSTADVVTDTIPANAIVTLTLTNSDAALTKFTVNQVGEDADGEETLTPVEVTAGDTGTYTFKMPAANVKIATTFATTAYTVKKDANFDESTGYKLVGIYSAPESVPYPLAEEVVSRTTKVVFKGDEGGFTNLYIVIDQPAGTAATLKGYWDTLASGSSAYALGLKDMTPNLGSDNGLDALAEFLNNTAVASGSERHYYQLSGTEGTNEIKALAANLTVTALGGEAATATITAVAKNALDSFTVEANDKSTTGVGTDGETKITSVTEAAASESPEEANNEVPGWVGKTLTVTPAINSKRVLATVVVKYADSGIVVETTRKEDGTFEFEMPDAAVTVEVVLDSAAGVKVTLGDDVKDRAEFAAAYYKMTVNDEDVYVAFESGSLVPANGKVLIVAKADENYSPTLSQTADTEGATASTVADEPVSYADFAESDEAEAMLAAGFSLSEGQVYFTVSDIGKADSTLSLSAAQDGVAMYSSAITVGDGTTLRMKYDQVDSTGAVNAGQVKSITTEADNAELTVSTDGSKDLIAAGSTVELTLVESGTSDHETRLVKAIRILRAKATDTPGAAYTDEKGEEVVVESETATTTSGNAITNVVTFTMPTYPVRVDFVISDAAKLTAAVDTGAKAEIKGIYQVNGTDNTEPIAAEVFKRSSGDFFGKTAGASKIYAVVEVEDGYVLGKKDFTGTSNDIAVKTGDDADAIIEALTNAGQTIAAAADGKNLQVVDVTLAAEGTLTLKTDVAKTTLNAKQFSDNVTGYTVTWTAAEAETTVATGADSDNLSVPVGDTVTVTVTPAVGKELITVTAAPQWKDANGRAVANLEVSGPTTLASGKLVYTFTMPEVPSDATDTQAVNLTVTAVASYKLAWGANIEGETPDADAEILGVWKYDSTAKTSSAVTSAKAEYGTGTGSSMTFTGGTALAAGSGKEYFIVVKPAANKGVTLTIKKANLTELTAVTDFAEVTSAETISALKTAANTTDDVVVYTFSNALDTSYTISAKAEAASNKLTVTDKGSAATVTVDGAAFSTGTAVEAGKAVAVSVTAANGYKVSVTAVRADESGTAVTDAEVDTLEPASETGTTSKTYTYSYTMPAYPVLLTVEVEKAGKVVISSSNTGATFVGLYDILSTTVNDKTTYTATPLTVSIENSETVAYTDKHNVFVLVDLNAGYGNLKVVVNNVESDALTELATYDNDYKSYVAAVEATEAGMPTATGTLVAYKLAVKELNETTFTSDPGYVILKATADAGSSKLYADTTGNDEKNYFMLSATGLNPATYGSYLTSLEAEEIIAAGATVPAGTTVTIGIKHESTKTPVVTIRQKSVGDVTKTAALQFTPIESEDYDAAYTFVSQYEGEFTVAVEYKDLISVTYPSAATNGITIEGLYTYDETADSAEKLETTASGDNLVAHVAEGATVYAVLNTTKDYPSATVQYRSTAGYTPGNVVTSDSKAYAAITGASSATLPLVNKLGDAVTADITLRINEGDQATFALSAASDITLEGVKSSGVAYYKAVPNADYPDDATKVTYSTGTTGLKSGAKVYVVINKSGLAAGVDGFTVTAEDADEAEVKATLVTDKTVIDKITDQYPTYATNGFFAYEITMPSSNVTVTALTAETGGTETKILNDENGYQDVVSGITVAAVEISSLDNLDETKYMVIEVGGTEEEPTYHKIDAADAEGKSVLVVLKGDVDGNGKYGTMDVVLATRGYRAANGDTTANALTGVQDILARYNGGVTITTLDVVNIVAAYRAANTGAAE